MVTLKLQYDTFETGEFTEEQSVDTDTLIAIFKEHTEIVKTKYSFTICKPYVRLFVQDGNNFLEVKHFAKDVFAVDYCNDPDTKLYTGNFYKRSVITILELFADGNFEALNKAIPRTKKSEEVLVKQFKPEDFTYTYRYRGLWSLLFNIIMPLPLTLLWMIFIVMSFSNPIYLFLALIFSYFPAILVMLLLLNHNYIKNSKGKSIRISSGSPEIVYTNNGVVSVINKSEIKGFSTNVSSGPRNPFAGFSYTRIVLNDGSAIVISHLLLDPLFLKAKMLKISNKTVFKFYPYIRKGL